jgi:UDP-glucose 4-epimerase
VQRTPVLVTGGAGYIGSHVVLELLDNGWPVLVLDNLVTGHAWAIDRRARFVEGDIGNLELVRQLLADFRIRSVIHMAGSVVVPDSVADPIGYYWNNTARTCRLLQAVIEQQVPHLLFSSTATLYGIPERVPMDEDCRLDPLNPYGRSKLMTEMMLRDAAAAHALRYCTLRYFNVAGADHLGRSGQSTRGATHLVKVAVEAALGKRDHVDVFGQDYDTPDGTGVRDYIHVSDLAAAHIHALQLLIGSPGQSFTLNCGYGRGYSVLDVLDAVDRVSGVTVERRFAPRRAGDPPILVADTARMQAMTRWQPRFDSLDRIIADAIAWEHKLTDRAALELRAVPQSAGRAAQRAAVGAREAVGR